MLCWFKVRSWLQAREICGSGTGGQSFYRETGADGSDTPPPPPQPNFQSCNASLKTKLSLMVLVKEVENIFRFFTFQGRRVRNDENRKKKKVCVVLVWFWCLWIGSFLCCDSTIHLFRHHCFIWPDSSDVFCCHGDQVLQYAPWYCLQRSSELTPHSTKTWAASCHQNCHQNSSNELNHTVQRTDHWLVTWPTQVSPLRPL